MIHDLVRSSYCGILKFLSKKIWRKKIQDPKNKNKTITMDKEDYLSGTDFRDEQQVIDSPLLDKLRIQKENVESKIDLTKQLTIQDF